jgi:hypothetical protein
MLTDSGCLPAIPKFEAKKSIYRDFQKAADAAEKQQWFHNPPSIRTREQIIVNGSYDQEIYRPKPTKNMNTEKIRYQEQWIKTQPEKVIEKREEIDEVAMRMQN